MKKCEICGEESAKLKEPYDISGIRNGYCDTQMCRKCSKGLAPILRSITSMYYCAIKAYEIKAIKSYTKIIKQAQKVKRFPENPTRSIRCIHRDWIPLVEKCDEIIEEQRKI